MMSGETAVDRSVYALSGADVLTFLQGMLTNDVLPLARSTGIVWSALLTPQGKYLADFFVVHTADHLLLDIKTAVAEAAVRRLLMYRLRADAQIVRTDLHVTRGLGPAPDAADVETAVREGALLRVRPKAMTVAVILAGLFPILIGTGAGSEVMSRIAAPMIGGMLTAPLLSMLVIPAAYLLMRRRSGIAPG